MTARGAVAPWGAGLQERAVADLVFVVLTCVAFAALAALVAAVSRL
ncbi:MAG: hypothetical protein FWD18_08750 [Micrococcales bacterium]|nr:hypothetical protein [Micrococcales bacterium]